MRIWAEIKKRKIFVLCILTFILLLTGCSSGKRNSKEELIQQYLTAVQNENYEEIWSMIPEEIQEYAIEQNIIANKARGLKYIEYAVNDYYWLAESNLPKQNNFTYKITESGKEDAEGVQAYFERYGVDIVVKEAAYDVVLIRLDNGDEIEADFFMIKTNDGWYLTSVVGDDEIFEY